MRRARKHAGGVEQRATTGQFLILRGDGGRKLYLWCGHCVTEVELTKSSDPHAVTAEAELHKREHDAATCQANQGKPDWARQWTKGD